MRVVGSYLAIRTLGHDLGYCLAMWLTITYFPSFSLLGCIRFTEDRTQFPRGGVNVMTMEFLQN